MEPDGGDLVVKSRADIETQTAVTPHPRHPKIKQQIATNHIKLRSNELKSWFSQKNVPEIILQQQLLHWGERLLDGN